MAHLNDQPHVDAHLRYKPFGIDSNCTHHLHHHHPETLH